jgi:predicted metal-dependent phosphoesterase TrpH
MIIDLHTHSSESDGSFSVEALINKAWESGVSALALTDHDTTAGNVRFLKEAAGKIAKPIPGVEISATWEKGNCHIVGLGIDKKYDPLEVVLRNIRKSRDERNAQIVKKLCDCGCQMELSEVEALAGGDVVARPHIAQIMVAKGYVASIQEAFDNYLDKSAPAYVDRYRLDPQDAVGLLADAGALVVLAHPNQLKLPYAGIATLVRQLVPFGLSGVEVYVPYASDADIEAYKSIAQDNKLFCSGGSDFHGDSKPDHVLGYYRENAAIPDSCLQE